jgi:4a-hydroxytetrahydrobiopterin dehydratase
MAQTTLPQELGDAGWSLAKDGKSIAKTYRFRSFREALAWMVRAGFEAEAMDHHPDWTNVYNRVEVRLTTHDTGGLTPKDIELASRMETLGVTPRPT